MRDKGMKSAEIRKQKVESGFKGLGRAMEGRLK
jgi:hypothetical protein